MNQQPDPNNPPTSSPENQPRYVFIAGPIADSDEIQSIEDGIPGGIHHFIGRETAASETPIWAIVEFMTYVQAKHVSSHSLFFLTNGFRL